MGFEIIKAETRLANLVTWYAGLQSRITDFIVGGKVRTKLEAIAVEMERQDFETKRLVLKAIPTAIYTTFDFSLLPAVRAYGEVTFTASPAPTAAFTIPIGTRVATTATTTSAAKVYETIADAAVQVGQTSITVGVVCSTPGQAGNTGASTINTIQSAIPGITAVTNVSQLGSGSDIETEEARRLRFRAYIATLTRGTSTAIAYGSKTVSLLDANGNPTERVVSVNVGEPPATGAAGTCSAYIFNGSGTASNELITKCQKVLDGYYDDFGAPVPGYKAAGMILTVASATTLAQTVSASISAMPGYDNAAIKTKAESAIASYFQSLGVGDNLIRHELVQRIMTIDGVYNVALNAPSADVEPTASQVVIQSTTTVTVSTQVF